MKENIIPTLKSGLTRVTRDDTSPLQKINADIVTQSTLLELLSSLEGIWNALLYFVIK